MAVVKPWHLHWIFDGECANTAGIVEILPTKKIHDISHLIKTKLRKKLRDVPEDQITIWCVSIKDGVDNENAPILLDYISHKSRLQSKTTISTLFPNGIPANSIHLIVQLLATTFDILGLVGQDKDHASFDWSTIVETATLADLKKRLYRSYPELACDDQYIEIGLPIRGDLDEKSDPIHDDESLRSILRLAKMKFEPHISMYIRTPSKNFSSRTYQEVCDLYGLSDLFFDIQSMPFPSRVDSRLQGTAQDQFIYHIQSWLKRRYPTWPKNPKMLDTSKIVDKFTNATIRLSDLVLYRRGQGYISGRERYGPMHTLLISNTDPSYVVGGLTEVRWRGDFEQGIIQNVAQLEAAVLGRDTEEEGIFQNDAQLQSALSQRKGLEIDICEPHAMRRTRYGIVTDAETWAFLECTLNENYQISFRISILDEKLDYCGTWKDDAISVCGKIIWIFSRMEDQIPIEKRLKESEWRV